MSCPYPEFQRLSIHHAIIVSLFQATNFQSWRSSTIQHPNDDREPKYTRTFINRTGKY